MRLTDARDLDRSSFRHLFAHDISFVQLTARLNDVPVHVQIVRNVHPIRSPSVQSVDDRIERDATACLFMNACNPQIPQDSVALIPARDSWIEAEYRSVEPTCRLAFEQVAVHDARPFDVVVR